MAKKERQGTDKETEGGMVGREKAWQPGTWAAEGAITGWAVWTADWDRKSFGCIDEIGQEPTAERRAPRALLLPRPKRAISGDGRGMRQLASAIHGKQWRR